MLLLTVVLAEGVLSGPITVRLANAFRQADDVVAVFAGVRGDVAKEAATQRHRPERRRGQFLAFAF